MTKPIETCYLHIGAEKTGSTSIQAFLSANRDKLADFGCLFPRTPGEANQPTLAAYAQNDTSNENLMALAGIREGQTIENFRAWLRRSLAAEIASARNAVTMVLTNEHCHSRIRTAEEAKRLADLIGEFANRVRIIFYVRRQDLAAASLLTTALKMGHSRKRADMELRWMTYYYNYWGVTRTYEEAFGEGSVEVRLFDRRHFVGGDLLKDFCTVIGLPVDASWVFPPQQNRSLDPVAQRFLSAFNLNIHDRLGPDADDLRRSLISTLEELHTGKGVMPPAKAARKFLDLYQWGNEKLRQRYFPDLPAPLFGDDFSMYEQEDRDWMPTVKQALDVGAELWVHQERRITALEQELKSLKARKK